ncbi:hypothetical protein CC86DRAFT_383659 [Ophiobolus disseminans]|uniref:Uncharacterized protein n=1 Tax=Ophiobolus disseminans TaxID=1469910 RepID=A0A6A6ZWY4_9PLEO|nr:hypothetical protein CC86DRAFT_383659 [Ophiobolus disseminans]
MADKRAATPEGTIFDGPNALGETEANAHSKAGNTKWYFSAAAVVVEFLKHLPTHKRQYLRRIELHEDFKSVNRPEYHARGLIQYCVENLLLRIERHIGLLSNMLPLTSKYVDRRGSVQWRSQSSSNWIKGEEALYATWDWVEEALQLSARGMPRQCFKLTIDGSNREAQEAWDLIKHVALLQEAMNLWGAYHEKEAGPVKSDPYSFYSRWPVPWYMPAHFPQTIRDIMRGSSIVRFPGTDSAP